MTTTSRTRLEFDASVVRDNGYTMERLGSAHNTMELCLHEGKPSGCIEWIAVFRGGEEIVTEIGVWFDHAKTLIDYDGCFELPTEAASLLLKAGFVVPAEFTRKE